MKPTSLPPVLKLSDCLLLIIDVQGRLAESMLGKEELYKNLTGLIKAAQTLDIPVLHTEQVPEKLGATIDPMASLLKGQVAIAKKTFSCCGEPQFIKTLKQSKKKTILVAGIETHVCVYQTAQDLLRAKYRVYVVADAVSSRKPTDKHFGLSRMQNLGAQMVSTEMLLTELIHTSAHPKFKDILNLIR
jgi:nicotinamidase-related amidase